MACPKLVVLLALVLAVPIAGAEADASAGVSVEVGVSNETLVATNLTLNELQHALPVVGQEVSRPPEAGVSPRPTHHPTPTQVATTAAAGLSLALLLAYLFKGLGIGLFSRFEGEQVLDHPMRRLLLELVDRNPAISLSDLVRASGAGWGTVVFHLRRLEAERLLVSERVRGRRCYFRNGGAVANDEKRPFAELQNDTALLLARMVLERPGVAQKELCAAAGLKAPVAHKYLERMANANLLAKQREWRTVKYFPTPQLAGWA